MISQSKSSFEMQIARLRTGQFDLQSNLTLFRATLKFFFRLKLYDECIICGILQKLKLGLGYPTMFQIIL